MRLICPNCDAQYEVDASMLPPEGRDVQCSACGKVWFHRPGQATAQSLQTSTENISSAQDEDIAPATGFSEPRRSAGWARGAAPPPESAPVEEARFFTDDDLDAGDDGLTPTNPLEWQEAWDRALGKAPSAPQDASEGKASRERPDNGDWDAPADRGSRSAASSPEELQDDAADYAEALEELNARTQNAPPRSRTEIAARRAYDVLTQKDPPISTESDQDLAPQIAAPSEAPFAPEDAPRAEAETPAPPAPGSDRDAEHAFEDEDLAPIPVASATQFPYAAHGLDEPRFDDSLQDQSPGEPVTVAIRPDYPKPPVTAGRSADAEPQDGLDPLDPEDFPTEALLRRLRRSRPELPPEEPEDDEPLLDEPEGVDPLPRRPKLDEEKLALLREEVDRETRARAAEAARAAGRALEMQPELGLAEQDPPARLRIGPRSVATEAEDVVPPPRETAAAQNRSPRRELLPDIERINQTLSASARTGTEVPPQQAAEAQRKGFRRGFVVALASAVLLALVYQSAEMISAQVPALRPLLESYSALVDGARLGIDRLLRTLLDSQSL